VSVSFGLEIKSTQVKSFTVCKKNLSVHELIEDDCLYFLLYVRATNLIRERKFFVVIFCSIIGCQHSIQSFTE
jgi:hypothetical protein